MAPIKNAPDAPVTLTLEEQRREKFFESIHNTLNADQLMLDTGTAPEYVRKMYEVLMQNDHVAMAAQMKDTANWMLTKMAILQFLQHILKSSHRPKHLAFNDSNATLLVWAVIGDNDEEAEDALFIAEAKVNNQLYASGYKVSATVVEERDRLPVPAHYQDFILAS